MKIQMSNDDDDDDDDDDDLVVSETWQDTGLRERFAHVMFASTQ